MKTRPPQDLPRNDSVDVSLIKSIRRQSNDAIARHDAAAVASFLHSSYQVCAGNGDLFHGSAAQKQAAWEYLFTHYDDVVYLRTPEFVEVSSESQLAYEQGRWTGSMTLDGRATSFAGRYSAAWRKSEAQWKIHAELFVTLSSDAAGDTV